MASGKDTKSPTTKSSATFAVAVIAIILAPILILMVRGTDNSVLPSKTSLMTEHATGTVVRVFHGSGEDRHGYRYDVSYEDHNGVRHIARALNMASTKEYPEKTRVNLRYDPANPDKECLIVGKAKPTTTTPSESGSGNGDDSSEDGGGSSSSSGSGSSSSSSHTLVQQWLENGANDGSDDALSDITHFIYEQNHKK